MTPWRMRVISPGATLILEMPDVDSPAKGIICPLLLNGATVFIGGAKNPRARNDYVPAITPEWRAKK